MDWLWALIAFVAGLLAGVAIQSNREPVQGLLSPGKQDEIMAAVDDLRVAITDYIAKVDAAFVRLNDGIASIQAQLDSDEATDAAAIQPLLDQVKAASDAVPAPPPEVTEPPA